MVHTTTFDHNLSDGIPVFRPTMAEFEDFYGYMQSIESQCAAGLAKIVPPPEWVPRRRYDDLEEYVVNKPIKQEFHGRGGVFFQVNVVGKSKTIARFRDLADSTGHKMPDMDAKKPASLRRRRRDVVEGAAKEDADAPDAVAPTEAAATAAALTTETKGPKASPPPKQVSPETEALLEKLDEIEYSYWRSIHVAQPYYGADMQGSLFDDDVTAWNLRSLKNELDRLPAKLPGVNVPYLYFGMWRATFSWHVEDMDLFSINFLHFGAPKQWYCVAPEHREKFEKMAQGIFATEFQQCSEFLRHKTSLFSPDILNDSGIPFHRVVQEAGQFIVTMPGAYHAGFNHGFNCAESVNFALPSWIPIGKEAKSCECVNDSVTIDMKVFDPNWSKEPKSDVRMSKQDEEASPMETNPQATPAAKPQKSRKRTAEEDARSTKKHKTAKAPALATTEVAAAKPKHTFDKMAPNWPVMPGVCTVCFSQVPSKPVMSCACGLSVHADCYGLDTKLASEFFSFGRFECDVCIAHCHEAVCALCPVLGGPLKPSREFQWCHVNCANSIPETRFVTEERKEFVVGLSDVPHTRYAETCSVCGQRSAGACVKCKHEGCNSQLHMGCVIAKRLLKHKHLQHQKKRALDGVCLKHDLEELQRKKQLELERLQGLSVQQITPTTFVFKLPHAIPATPYVLSAPPVSALPAPQPIPALSAPPPMSLAASASLPVPSSLPAVSFLQ